MTGAEEALATALISCSSASVRQFLWTKLAGVGRVVAHCGLFRRANDASGHRVPVT